MEEQTETEYAIANQVRVLETNILHATDVIYWLNGTTGEVAEEMQRLEKPLTISFDNQPADVSVLHTVGKSAIWRRPTTVMVAGTTTDAQRARPAQTPFNLTGEAWDYSRRFNPIAFDVSVGSDDGQSVIVYPSPLGTPIPAGGALFGRALIDSTSEPVIWGLLELVITVSVSESLAVRAQTDGNGDFVIPLTRLPPLPESITEYAAQLSLTSDSGNRIDRAPDLTTYSAVQLESTTTAASFSASLSLDVVPGQRMRVNSFGKDYLAVQ